MNRNLLASIAKEEVAKKYHGFVEGNTSNILPIISYFENWSLKEADGNWCATFVYHCCIKSGFIIPVRPKECVSCNLAGCGAWDEWARADERIGYYANDFTPEVGDIVLYDFLFEEKEHDHIGIVLENRETSILVAEGNLNNVSGIIERDKDSHIRAYIRISDNYSY